MSGPGHRFTSGGSLRAAVLGMNDGLVSNFSLVMGVSGGTGDPGLILLAGIAGLMSGAFSMAAGEYISMRSQRDVYEHQIIVAQDELLTNPKQQEDELISIYKAKGFSCSDSKAIAKQILSDPKVALDTKIREILGLNPTQLGSPIGAALSSFLAFALGASVPILPHMFYTGTTAIVFSGACGALALGLVGGVLARLTNRNIVWGSMRMLLAGGSAAIVTYGVGSLIGVALL